MEYSGLFNRETKTKHYENKINDTPFRPICLFGICTGYRHQGNCPEIMARDKIGAADEVTGANLVAHHFDEKLVAGNGLFTHLRDCSGQRKRSGFPEA